MLLHYCVDDTSGLLGKVAISLNFEEKGVFNRIWMVDKTSIVDCLHH
jgi:hypothetical protein